MRRIWLSADSMRLPEVCACCLRATQETLEVGKTKLILPGAITVWRDLRMSVPYCAECRTHAAWYQDLGIFGKALKAAFVVLMGAVLWALVVWALAG